MEHLILILAGLAAGALNAVAGGGTFLSFPALVFVGVTLAGTLWVMFHMNAHMMPDHANPMSGAPAQPAQHSQHGTP